MPVLTVPTILKYRPQAKRREIPDSRAQGLFLVIQPTGSMSWALRFRRGDGRPAKLTLGPVDVTDKETADEPELGTPHTLGQARQQAATIARQRARGIDPVAEHAAEKDRKRSVAIDRAANTFAAAVVRFFIDYKTKRGIRPRRWRDDAAVLGLRYPPGCNDPAGAEPETIKGGLAEVWAAKPVAEIDDHNLHAVINEARKHGGGPGRERRLHAALSVLFGWLKRERRIAANPMRELARPGPPASRERTLSDAEIVTLWKAADAVGGPFGALAKTLLLTGCRLREASGMRRAEVEDDGTWTIPSSRSKNHRPLALPLPKLALEIIAAVPVIESKAGLVFTTNGKTPVSGFSKAKRQLDAAMAKVAGKPVEPWRIHDLRRTAASGMAALGIQLPVIEKVLNHASGSFGGIVSVYQKHEFKDEKREALRRWAAHVEGLVADQPSNVTPLPKPKRRRK